MDDLYAKLLESSIRFVSYRPRSEKEFKDFLLKKLQRRKSSDVHIIDRVLLRLRDLGYADDAKFIRWWVEQRSTYRPKGSRILEQELLRKGIDKHLIEQNLDTKSGEFDSAKKAIERKLKLWEKLPRLAFKQKVYGFLSRRGFTGDTTRRIIDEVVRGEVESREHD